MIQPWVKILRLEPGDSLVTTHGHHGLFIPEVGWIELPRSMNVSDSNGLREMGQSGSGPIGFPLRLPLDGRVWRRRTLSHRCRDAQEIPECFFQRLIVSEFWHSQNDFQAMIIFLTISSCSISEAFPEMWIRANAADADANVPLMLGNVGVRRDGGGAEETA